jgi:hypothetical protein
VNIGDPWPGLDEAEMRVLATGEKAAPLGERPIPVDALMISITSSMTRPSWWLPGTGCGATRAHARPESTGLHRGPSGSVLQNY